MIKHRILIGSVLKPTNDSRMYEKIGKSLSLLPNTEIHIAGLKSKQKNETNILFYPIFCSSRLSILRFFAPWYFLFRAVKVKPDTIIVSTHELLIVTFLYKILFGCQFIYDVQENYFHNILYTDAFPSLIKPSIAHWVRLKERMVKRWIDGYLLAEKIYKIELADRIHEPILILENKYIGPLPERLKIVKNIEERKIKLLYSGTIAGSYGVFEAIDLAIKMHLFDYRYELTIIGFAPKCSELSKIKNRIAPFPFIKLIGGNHPVDHSEILSAIDEHQIGLLPYRFNESTHLRVPTKLFEYFLHRLPVICSSNPTWEEYIQKFQAGIVIPFNNLPPAAEIKRALSNIPFYEQGNEQELLWEDTLLLDWYKNELNVDL
jgi:glycosyltransferase involved in cell wall biosynthesis